MPNSPTDEKRVFTVSQLTREARLHLESGLGRVWLEGEISNLARPASGHLYFSLKDQACQVRCAFFRNYQRGAKPKLQDGQQVLIRAQVTLYENRGEFQLVVESVEPLGSGQLQREFEKLKQKLAEQGLFEQQHKSSIPAYPKRIGLITSASGAALRDVLHVLKRRAPFIPVLIYPSSVQGANAAVELRSALQTALKRKECDLLMLVRGGGSLEDLWSFNDEQLARDIYNAEIPIISGIGHEIDFTIADFVADLRAPTPSAAAEMASPNQEDLQLSLSQTQQRLGKALQRLIHLADQKNQNLLHRLSVQHPERRIFQQIQRADELQTRLNAALTNKLTNARQLLQRLSTAFSLSRLKQQLLRHKQNLNNSQQLLQRSILQKFQTSNAELHASMRALDAVSPLATMDRGYAILTANETLEKIIPSIKTVTVKQPIYAHLKDGILQCTVDDIKQQ